MNQLMEATSDVKRNISMAADFLKVQKRLLRKQVIEMDKFKEAKLEKSKRLNKNNEEIELKGQERELLIKEVENLMKVRLEKDVVLIETGQESNRYIRCMYSHNRTTLHQFIEDFADVFADGLPEDMKENPIDSILQMLHDKKMLKKDLKPYISSVSKGFYEEKPSRIYLDGNKNAVRVETEAYITASGANRLRLKELKPFITASNSI
ncbi:hypothetical protein [Cytobacillus horneckiae]|uniref:hypothetical protein n=1 Tax=Cytobacillus horneckiae TaxID=549687 RepID=UPI0034CF5EA5